MKDYLTYILLLVLPYLVLTFDSQWAYLNVTFDFLKIILNNYKAFDYHHESSGC